jgi:hypothetical protein
LSSLFHFVVKAMSLSPDICVFFFPFSEVQFFKRYIYIEKM